MLTVSLSLIVSFTHVFLRSPIGQNIASSDWSGYVVLSDSTNPQPIMKNISGSWVVPTVKASQKDAFSAVWIGIGGQLDDTLIQTGTEHDSVDGQAVYSAWYELLPYYSVTIDIINVSAGDEITASIALTDSAINEWLLQISDVTSGESFSKNFFYDSSRLSAEWIVERPIVNNTLSTLADFESVTFTDLKVSTDTDTGSIIDFSFSRVAMYDRQNRQLVTVSSLDSKGSSFTVDYIG
jgi:hypothetical protein